MNQFSKRGPGDQGTSVPTILRGAADQLDVPTTGLEAIRRQGATRQNRRRAAIASTCAVLLVGTGVLAVQQLTAPADRSTTPGVAPDSASDSTTLSPAPESPVGVPVERVESAMVWNLVLPGSAEAIGSTFLGVDVTGEAPYLVWSTAPGRNTNGDYVPTLYQSDDGIHWTPAASGTFTEPQVSRRGIAAQGGTLFAFGTAAATAAIPKGGAGDAVVEVSTDGGASWQHQVLPIDLRGLAATDGVGGVGLSGGMAADDGVVVVAAQPYVWWDGQQQRDLIVTSQGAYTLTYPTCSAPDIEVGRCDGVATTVGPVAIGSTATTAPVDTAGATEYTATDDTLPILSDLIPLSELGIDPASVATARTLRVFFSTDGATFAEASLPPLPEEVVASGGGDVRVFASGGMFYVTLAVNTFDPSLSYGLASGRLVYRSADGVTWEQIGNLTSLAGQELFGALPDGTLVARSYNPTGFSGISTSRDGVTWAVHDLSPLLEPSDGEIVAFDLWTVTVGDEGITAVGNIYNDPIAEAGGRSVERDGVRLTAQSSLYGQLIAHDAATGAQIPDDRVRYTDMGGVEVLADDGSVIATFTPDDWKELHETPEGQRRTGVLLHSDDGVRWSRENLADLTGFAEVWPAFFQHQEGKVLVNLSAPSQSADALATTLVLVGTRK